MTTPQPVRRFTIPRRSFKLGGLPLTSAEYRVWGKCQEGPSCSPWHGLMSMTAALGLVSPRWRSLQQSSPTADSIDPHTRGGKESQ